MGSEDEAEQSVRRPCRPVWTTGSSRHANSPHPSSREGHLSTAGWISSFLLIGFDPERLSGCCRGRLYRGLVVSMNGRFKRTRELTSSIVPRGTSFHCWVDLEFSPYRV